MKDKVTGLLGVGSNEDGKVVINHPDLKPDENGVGHIVFSPSQARHLADLLHRKALEIEEVLRRINKASARKAAEEIPVDRSARVLADGSPVTEDHREINPSTGQQKGYVVLSPEERAKGFVRPVRRSYRHTKCGTVTRMGLAITETYARDPGFYSGTFCVGCKTHLPLNEFVWEGTDEAVGS